MLTFIKLIIGAASILLFIITRIIKATNKKKYLALVGSYQNKITINPDKDFYAICMINFQLKPDFTILINCELDSTLQIENNESCTIKQLFTTQGKAEVVRNHLIIKCPMENLKEEIIYGNENDRVIYSMYSSLYDKFKSSMLEIFKENVYKIIEENGVKTLKEKSEEGKTFTRLLY